MLYVHSFTHADRWSVFVRPTGTNQSTCGPKRASTICSFVQNPLVISWIHPSVHPSVHSFLRSGITCHPSWTCQGILRHWMIDWQDGPKWSENVTHRLRTTVIVSGELFVELIMEAMNPRILGESIEKDRSIIGCTFYVLDLHYNAILLQHCFHYGPQNSVIMRFQCTFFISLHSLCEC